MNKTIQFDDLFITTMKWKTVDWKSKACRFTPRVSYDWEYVYWCEDQHFPSACAYLKRNGYDYETSYDNCYGLMIVTNYKSAIYKKKQ